jgi:hypothetical protein
MSNQEGKGEMNSPGIIHQRRLLVELPLPPLKA